jgi:glycosyltransferase involved in cell wall biosynthesis
VVVATNEEYVLPFAVGSFERPRFLLCDLIDSLPLRISDRFRYIRPIWTALSAIARREVDGLVDVTHERLKRHRILPRHTTVVFNSPVWSEIESRPGLPARSIYVCGSMNDGINGLETLLESVERIDGVQIVFAGRLNGTWLNTVFANHPKVLNLGETTPAESLGIAKGCSALFAHYKPFTPNFVWAAPNKLFDAMMTGIPILINSDCKASEAAANFGIGLSTPYGDSEQLERALRHAVDAPTELRANCAQAQQLFRTEYAWEHMRHRWRRLFSAIGVFESVSGMSEDVVVAQ